MADNIDAASLAKAGFSQSAIDNFMQATADKAKAAAESVSQYGRVAASAVDTNNKLASSTMTAGEASSATGKLFDALADNASDLLFQGALLTDTVRKLTAAFKETSNFSGIGQNIDAVAASYGKLGTAAGAVLEKMGFSKGMTEWVMGLANSSSYARTMETSIVNLAASTGTLGELMKKTGNDFENLNEVAISFDQQNLKIANSMGVLKPEAEGAAIALGKIPHALSTSFMIESIGNISELQTAMTIAKASGQSYAEVISSMSKSYTDYGQSGMEAVAFQAQMAESATRLDVPLKMVKDTAENMSDSFRKFGNNTDSSIKLLNQMVPALREVGVHQKQIGEISNSVATSIAGMDTAHRAFLSARSGGPGGLRGAMQVEAMLMKGDAAGVAKMAEDAMRKRFGKVVGFEEAQQSQGAAAQFERQRQMLGSGAFGLKLEGPDATKFLDAMSKGKVFDVTKAGQGPQDALAATMKIGNGLIERNRDALVESTNNLMYNTAALQSFRDLQILRRTTGNKSGLSDAMRARAAGPGGSRDEAAMAASTGKMTSERQYDKSKDAAVQAATSGVANIGKSFIAAIVDAAMEGSKDIKDKTSKAEKQKEILASSGLPKEAMEVATRAVDRKAKYGGTATQAVSTELMEIEKRGGAAAAAKLAPKPTRPAVGLKPHAPEEGAAVATADRRVAGAGSGASVAKVLYECPTCHQTHGREQFIQLHTAAHREMARGATSPPTP